MQILGITSGKTFVGKTNFVLNFAVAMSIKKKKVLIVDGSLNQSNIAQLLGIYPQYTLINYIDKEILVDKLLTTAPCGLKYLSAYSGDIMVTQNTKKYQETLVSIYMDMRKDFDYIIIDAGVGINDTTLGYLNTADRIVIVTTPESSSITDAYAMIKILYFRSKTQSLSILINMVQSKEEAVSIYNKINLIVQHFLNKSVGNFGFIFTDNHVKEAVLSQTPFVEKEPNCTASLNINNILDEFIEEAKV